MKTILTFSLAAFALAFPEIATRPKILAEPAPWIAFSGNVGYVFETEGNVSANTTYNVSCSAPSYFSNVPSTIVVPQGSNTANLNVTYNGGDPGNVTFTISKDGYSASSTVYYGFILPSATKKDGLGSRPQPVLKLVKAPANSK